MRLRTALPPGTHAATWNAFAARFGGNEHRLRQLGSLHAALMDLRHAGVQDAFVAGSFVTSKRHPGDVDVMYRLAAGASQARAHAAEVAAREAGPVSLWNMYEEVRTPGSLLRSQTIDELFRSARSGSEVGVLQLRLADLPDSPGQAVEAVRLLARGA